MNLKYLLVTLLALLSLLVLAGCGLSLPQVSSDDPPAETEATATDAAESTEVDEAAAETSDAEATAEEPTAEEATAEEPAAEEATAEEPAEPEFITTESGLQYMITEAGTGDSPEPGDTVQVHYIGTLEDGTEFDNSYDRGEPIAFTLGQGQVIAGWDEGIELLNVGDKATLIIPPELGYGEQGAGGGTIPPNATLTFEVELVGFEAALMPTEVPEEEYVTTPSGLQYFDLIEGEGETPEAGQTVIVHYTGWLEDGTQFDSSYSRGLPFTFELGAGRVIEGWDEGVASMQVGGTRQLRIPPDLAYGEAGIGGVIPPNATLIFEVELLGFE